MKKLRRQPGPSYIGPVPDEVIEVRLEMRKIPSQAWQDAHPDGLAEQPPSPEETVLQCVAIGIYAEPSRLQHPANWPTAVFPIAELFQISYADFLKRAKMELAKQRGEQVTEPEPAAAPPADAGLRSVPAEPEASE